MRNLSIYNIRYIGFPLSVLCIQFIISCVPFILLSSNAALLRCLLPSSIHCPVANSYSLVFISFIFSSGCSACKRLPLLMLSFFQCLFHLFLCVYRGIQATTRLPLFVSFHFVLYTTLFNAPSVCVSLVLRKILLQDSARYCWCNFCISHFQLCTAVVSHILHSKICAIISPFSPGN